MFGQVLGPGISVDDNERKQPFCASIPNAPTKEGDKQPRLYHADGFRPLKDGHARTLNKNLYKLDVSKKEIVFWFVKAEFTKLKILTESQIIDPLTVAWNLPLTIQDPPCVQGKQTTQQNVKSICSKTALFGKL